MKLYSFTQQIVFIEIVHDFYLLNEVECEREIRSINFDAAINAF